MALCQGSENEENSFVSSGSEAWEEYVDEKTSSFTERLVSVLKKKRV